ncbi:hypothetical protein QUB56_25580 [Microcoleus sp. AR_TQ3_B6]
MEEVKREEGKKIFLSSANSQQPTANSQQTYSFIADLLTKV